MMVTYLKRVTLPIHGNNLSASHAAGVPQDRNTSAVASFHHFPCLLHEEQIAFIKGQHHGLGHGPSDWQTMGTMIVE